VIARHADGLMVVAGLDQADVRRIVEILARRLPERALSDR
jgi:hypothetical protein